MKATKWMLLLVVALVAISLVAPAALADNSVTNLNNLDVPSMRGGNGNGQSQGQGRGNQDGSNYADEDGDGVCDDCGRGNQDGTGSNYSDEDGDGVCDNCDGSYDGSRPQNGQGRGRR